MDILKVRLRLHLLNVTSSVTTNLSTFYELETLARKEETPQGNAPRLSKDNKWHNGWKEINKNMIFETLKELSEQSKKESKQEWKIVIHN